MQEKQRQHSKIKILDGDGWSSFNMAKTTGHVLTDSNKKWMILSSRHQKTYFRVPLQLNN